MEKKQLKTLAVLGLLFIGVKMESKQFKYYGLLADDMQIKTYIEMVCNVISPGSKEEAKILLAETIAVETLSGRATDHSPEYGEGLTQFDRGTFNHVIDYFSKSKYQDLKNKINLLLGVDLEHLQYSDLRSSPMASIVLARLLYLSKPGKLPHDLNGRWLYYKRYFNSYLGATEKEDYYNRIKYSVIKDSESKQYV